MRAVLQKNVPVDGTESLCSQKWFLKFVLCEPIAQVTQLIRERALINIIFNIMSTYHDGTQKQHAKQMKPFAFVRT